MKKRIVTGLFAMMAVVSIATVTYAEENILQEMAEANTLTELLKDKERTAYQDFYYMADGTEDSSYVYSDKTLQAYEGNDSVMIMQNNELTGFDNDTKCMFAFIGLDDGLEVFAKDTFQLANFKLVTGEEVIDINEEGTITYVTTLYAPDSQVFSDIFEMAANMGYEMSDSDSIMSLYAIEEDREIVLGQMLIQQEGEMAKVIAETKRVSDPEVYVAAPEIAEALNNPDSRTVKVICDPGTEYEKVYEKTVGKGCNVRVAVSLEHPYLYTDEGCTTLFAGDADLQKDITLYSKKEMTESQSANAEVSADESVQCEYCGEWFENSNLYRNHICPERDAAYAGDQEVDESDSMQCPYCGEWFYTEFYDGHIAYEMEQNGELSYPEE